MIPVKYLKPCVKALSELVNNYGCSVVLCTATQPCLDGLFAEEGHEVREIAANPAALATALSRVRYQSDGAVADDALAQSLLGQHQALCIVNSRKQARALYDKLAEQSKDGLFHLTTMMHPLHRQKRSRKLKRSLILINDALWWPPALWKQASTLISRWCIERFPAWIRSFRQVGAAIVKESAKRMAVSSMCSRLPAITLFQLRSSNALPWRRVLCRRCCRIRTAISR